jgi:hypothetical protein
VPVVDQCGFAADILANVPNAVESVHLESILSDDRPFALQRGVSRTLDLHPARKLFDKLIAQFPVVEICLSTSAAIVHSPIFEAAVI